MILSAKELAVLKPLNNLVLVKPVIKTDEIMLAGMAIKIDNTYKPEDHQAVICKVIATPPRLKYSRALAPDMSMPWKVCRQIQAGDMIWCNYLSVIKCEKVECDGEIYFLVPYEKIYLKKTGNSVTMINGFCLVEPIFGVVDPVTGELVTTDEGRDIAVMNTAKATRYGIVRYIGDPNTEYWDKRYFDDPNIKVGDTVMMRTSTNKYLESAYHKHFDGKRYWVVQRVRMVSVAARS